MPISSHSRLLFFAPHPDDESLAAGGLLQKAAAAGAQVRIVFVTSGDDNPWPLRLIERQWRITAGDRLLWAMRRMEEALEAISVLGLNRDCAHFLHQPDQQLTKLLLQRDATISAQLRETIREFQPTHLFAPAPFDLHPDHSALYLLVRQALLSSACEPVSFFGYAVHTRGKCLAPGRVALPLSADKQATKRRAILCHRSQMALSRGRFLRHVREEELFWPLASPRATESFHPVRTGRVSGGLLRLYLRRAGRTGTFARCQIFVAAGSREAGAVRWVLQLPWSSTRISVRDATTGQIVARAQVRITGAQAAVYLPFPDAAAWQELFVKLTEPNLFYDHAGWRELPINYDAKRDARFARALPSAQTVC